MGPKRLHCEPSFSTVIVQAQDRVGLIRDLSTVIAERLGLDIRAAGGARSNVTEYDAWFSLPDLDADHQETLLTSLQQVRGVVGVSTPVCWKPSS